MLNSKVSFGNGGIITIEKELCQNAKELIISKSFFILMERFCNVIEKEEPRYRNFLDKYFNDEGYVDVWRIPLLILDLYNGDMYLHQKLLEDGSFKSEFINFIGKFYNYCVVKEELLCINEKHFNDYHENMLFLKKNQHLANLIHDTFCKVIENIYSDKKKTGEVI